MFLSQANENQYKEQAFSPEKVTQQKSQANFSPIQQKNSFSDIVTQNQSQMAQINAVPVQMQAEKNSSVNETLQLKGNPQTNIRPFQLKPNADGEPSEKEKKKQEIRKVKKRIKTLKGLPKSRATKSMIKGERQTLKRIRKLGTHGIEGYNEENVIDFNQDFVSSKTGISSRLEAVEGGGVEPEKVTTTDTMVSARNADGSLDWQDVNEADAVEGISFGPYPVSSAGTNSISIEFWPTTANSRVQVWDATDPSEPNLLGQTMANTSGNALAVSQDIVIPNGVTNVLVQVWGGSTGGDSSENSGRFAIDISLNNTQTDTEAKTIKKLVIKDKNKKRKNP